MGVRVDLDLVSGMDGILLVPSFEGWDEAESGEWLPLDDFGRPLPVEVRSYRATRDPARRDTWYATQQLQHQSSHADRYALSMIAGTGRNRA
jgi:hypothetical protein